MLFEVGEFGFGGFGVVGRQTIPLLMFEVLVGC